MAAHRNVHLTKKAYHLVDGDPEFACHVVNEKLAQNLPPWIPATRMSGRPSGTFNFALFR
jgi:hypothetical protein